MRLRELIAGFLFTIVAFAAIGVVGTIEHNYIRRDCEVVEVCGAEVTVEDAAGHLWCIEGTNLYIGDKVDLHMHTNFTHGTIYDDYVVDVTRS